MKIFILLALVTLLTSCVSHRGTLYLDKAPATYTNGSVGTNYAGVLSAREQERIIRYLDRQTPRPVLVIGKDKSINSYREYCLVMNIPFPTVMTDYNVVNGPALEGMDYKDVWLSKGPPVAIFVTDEFVTWRYKDDSLTVFVEGKTVTLNR